MVYIGDAKQGMPMSFRKQRAGQFPGGPAAKNLISPSWGPGFIPGQGTRIPHAARKPPARFSEGPGVPLPQLRSSRGQTINIKKTKQSEEAPLLGFTTREFPRGLCESPAKCAKAKLTFPAFLWRLRHSAISIWVPLSPSKPFRCLFPSTRGFTGILGLPLFFFFLLVNQHNCLLQIRELLSACNYSKPVSVSAWVHWNIVKSFSCLFCGVGFFPLVLWGGAEYFSVCFWQISMTIWPK